ncbi:MAG: hypothetical protein V4538_00790 [Bacteroidota bacterium]
MKTRNIIILLLGIALFLACGKDNQINLSGCPTVEEVGKDIPPYRGPGWGFKYVQSDTFLGYVPCTNPNNKDEFVFWLATPSYSGIYTYNLKTKIRSLVLAATNKKGIPQSQPRWSRKGWILFDDRDHNIYKIKANGDSLTQLTQTSGEFVPEWNYEGTMFCTEYLSRTNQYYTMFRDENGNIIDSVQYQGRDLFLGQPDWQHGQYIIGNSNNDGVLLYDYKKKTTTEIDNKDVAFPRWINENEFIYAGFKVISIMNIKNRQIRIIRKPKNSYQSFNLLDNGQILCCRTTQYLQDSIMEVIATKTGVFLINQCDTNTIELNLR